MSDSGLLKDSEKALDQSKDRRREDFLEVVDQVIKKGLNYMNGKYTVNSERLGWARVVVQAVSVGADILKDADLDELRQRVEKLEVAKG